MLHSSSRRSAIHRVAILPGAILIVLAALLAAPAGGHADEGDADVGFPTAVAGLDVRSFNDKAKAIEALAGIQHPRVATVLRAMLGGELHRRKADGRIVIARREGREYALSDAIDGEALGTAGKRALSKIRVNNKLRGKLRGTLASLALSSPDPHARLAAAERLAKEASPASAALLREALEREADRRVAAMLRLGVATIDVRSPDAGTRVEAIEDLEGSLEPKVRALLASVLETDEDGVPIERDPQVRELAAKALETIDGRARIYKVAENLYFGVSLGSVLLLAAVGLAITFGVMRVINMAHGEMVMLGAYTTYLVQQLLPQAIEYSVLIAIPAAFLVAGAIGVILERTVIQHLYGRPLETLLATFGVSLILQQTVRTVFGPLNRSVVTPSWMSGTLEVNPVLALTYNRLYIIAFACLVLLGLALWLARSRFGLQIRAVTQDRAMARALGIRTDRVDAITFGVGAGVAGMAGVALSQLTNVGPNMGQAYIIDSFMVVVFGGVGNLLGTFFGAMTLGVANKLLEPVSGAVLAKILVLVFIILFIQRRPRGLFAQAGRSAEA